MGENPAALRVAVFSLSSKYPKGAFKRHPPAARGLTRAPLGYSAERAPLRGGQILPPPLPNSRNNRRSEAGQAAIESPEREDSNAY